MNVMEKHKENAELFNKRLPKWPQMIVTGKKITEEQALEIIRRTDTFITQGYDGNNHDFNEKARQILKIKSYPWRSDYKKDNGEIDEERYRTELNNFDIWQEEFKNKWATIETEYVKNSWISCSFIGGPHGWCNPDGTIKYYDNVGKWPSVDEIYNDWVKIAKAFPFLEIGVTLINGEGCEEDIEPVVSFKIKEGKVYIVDPEKEDVHEEYKINKLSGLDKIRINYAIESGNRGFPVMFGRENAISFEILKKWSKQVWG